MSVKPATEEKILQIWSAILGKNDICAEKSFFEQGGTSLGALSVLSRYFNEGMEMTMAQFYENPTAAARRSCYPGAGCTGTTGSGRRNIPRRFLRPRRFCPARPAGKKRRCFSPEPQAFSVRIC
ncbi:MAG: acyl carrier protein [Eisenbergiella massiliensis]